MNTSPKSVVDFAAILSLVVGITAVICALVFLASPKQGIAVVAEPGHVVEGSVQVNVHPFVPGGLVQLAPPLGLLVHGPGRYKAAPPVRAPSTSTQR